MCTTQHAAAVSKAGGGDGEPARTHTRTRTARCTVAECCLSHLRCDRAQRNGSSATTVCRRPTRPLREPAVVLEHGEGFGGPCMRARRHVAVGQAQSWRTHGMLMLWACTCSATEHVHTVAGCQTNSKNRTGLEHGTCQHHGRTRTEGPARRVCSAIHVKWRGAQGALLTVPTTTRRTTHRRAPGGRMRMRDYGTTVRTAVLPCAPTVLSQLEPHSHCLTKELAPHTN